MKRQRFYVNSMIWGQGLGPAPIALYAYLSRCADAEGKCFPAVPDMAQAIGASESTVKRALKALYAKGLLIKEARFHETKRGGRRCGSNEYTLVGSAYKGGPRTGASGSREGASGDGHINNKNINTRGLSPSLSYERPDGRGSIRDEDVERLLSDLDPHIYDDEHYGNAVEAAIREMWFGSCLKINGSYVKQDQVRKRLLLLNIECLDDVYRALGDAEDVENKAQFLKVCLYNAPLRFGAQIASQISRRVNYR